MLLEQKVKIKWSSSNRKYYESKGYVFTWFKTEFLVDIKDLAKSSRQYVKFLCDYCGNVFERKYADYNRNKNVKLQKDACHNCKGEKIKESNLIHYGVPSTSLIPEVRQKQLENDKSRWTYEKVKKVIEKEGYKLLTDKNEKIYSYTKLKIKCPSNHIFMMDIHHFNNHGNRCPKCSRCYVKTTDEFKQELQEKTNGEYVLIDEYINAHTKVRFKHIKCNRIFINTPSCIINQGSRCPYCYNNRISNAVLLIDKLLNNYNIYFINEYRFEKCRDKKSLPFDFALFNNDDNYLKMLIEYDGEQHFKSVECFGGKDKFKEQIRRDKIKNRYCIDNNIPLIRIPYWEYDNIEYILKNVLMHFNLIKKDDTYDESVVKKYLVDENWDHDKYIEMSKNY